RCRAPGSRAADRRCRAVPSPAFRSKTTPPHRRRRCRARRVPGACALHLLVSVDHRLSFRPGLLLPILEHGLADLLQIAGELWRRLDDGHAFLLELIEIPA